jgi:hypothetical protein
MLKEGAERGRRELIIAPHTAESVNEVDCGNGGFHLCVCFCLWFAFV